MWVLSSWALLLSLFCWTTTVSQNHTCDITEYSSNSTNISSACVINCLSQNECKDGILICDDSMDCEINCLGNSGCMNSVILCPSNHECDIICDDLTACYNSTIKSSKSSKLNLTCNDGNSCLLSDVTCPDNNDNNDNNYDSDCEITCNGLTACQYARINSSNNGSLYIDCNGDNRCFGSKIYCPFVNGECNVDCSGKSSCQEISIFCNELASDEQKCSIDDIFNCSEDDACLFINLTVINAITTTATDEIGKNNNSDDEIIVIIIIMVVAIIIAIVICVFVYCRLRKKAKNDINDKRQSSEIGEANVYVRLSDHNSGTNEKMEGKVNATHGLKVQEIDNQSDDEINNVNN